MPKELISLLVTMFTDVRDEAYEGKYSRLQVTSNSMLRVLDSLARLSVCTVPSSESSHTALLPHFLSPRSSLLHTLIIIVLDWTRPWTFVEELQTWLTWVETWSKGDASRELEIIREESRERRKFHLLLHYFEIITLMLQVQSHLQHYSSSTFLPLGSGILLIIQLAFR